MAIKIPKSKKVNELETKVNEHSSIFTYSKNLGINGVGTAIQLLFSIGEGKLPDKGTAFVFGSHNTAPFAAIIYFKKNGCQISNLVGTLVLKSATTQEDLSLLVRFDTTIWGTCSIYSTIPIGYAKYTN